LESLISGSGWYFKSREQFIKQNLRRLIPDMEILDIGCGDGLVARILNSSSVTGVDPEPLWDKGIKARAEHLPFKDSYFDAVTCFDVLEHIPDHERAIKEARRILKPNGYFFIMVPLHPRLWSIHDERLGHVRRYRPGELPKLLKNMGFTIEKTGRFMSFLLPAVALVRLIKPRSEKVSAVRCSSVIEYPLNLICRLELFFKGKLPFGLTEFILARKVAS